MQDLDLFGVRESRLHAAQLLKRANHQAGADEQHERERHLHDDQRVARPMALPALAGRSADTPQRRRDTGSCVFQDRYDPEERAREQRHTEGERQHERIDSDFAQPRQRVRTIRDQDPQRRHARPRPNAPPSTPSVMLSTSISRAIRPQPAPSAARIASSCWRASARTSNRLATFAQTIRSTSPRVPITTHSAVPMSPTMSCFSGWSRGPGERSEIACDRFLGSEARHSTRVPACEPHRRWPAPW